MEVVFRHPLLAGGDKSKCRVFTSCVPKKVNSTDLYRFGKVIIPFLEFHTIYPDRAEEWRDGKLSRAIHRAALAHKFDPQLDYVALMGDALLTAAVCYVLGRYFDSVTFLRYDTQLSSYWAFRTEFK